MGQQTRVCESASVSLDVQWRIVGGDTEVSHHDTPEIIRVWREVAVHGTDLHLWRDHAL